MNSLNVANDNALATTNDTAAVAGSITELSKWALPSSYALGETGHTVEMATPLVASIVAERFALQGNVAQFDLQGTSSMPGSDELIDKIELVESHTETKVERVGAKIDVLTATIVGKIDSLSGKIDKSDQYNHDTRWWLISIFVVGVFSLAGLIVALTSYGDARFGQGMNVRDVVQTSSKSSKSWARRSSRATNNHQSPFRIYPHFPDCYIGIGTRRHRAAYICGSFCGM